MTTTTEDAAPAGTTTSWVPLAVCCLTMFIIVLDTSMMNVAIPAITKDLNTNVSAVQAAVSLYSVVMASLMVTGGKVGDLHGVRRVFTIALVVYGIGTLLAAVSWNIAILTLGWSVIEGVAAAALLPLTMTLIVSNYDGAQRALAFGVVGGVQAAAAAAGPIFGGFLTTAISWRWGFGFEVLIVVVIFPLVPRLRAALKKEGELDWVGSVLSTLGLISIVVAILLAGQYGWWTPRRPFTIGDTEISPFGLAPTPILFAFGALVLILFVHWQRHRERSRRMPLLRLDIFKNVPFVTGFTADGLQSLTIAGILFVLPLYFQSALGYDALGSGVALLPLSVSVFLVSIGAPRLGRAVQPRWLVLFGVIGMLVGVLWLHDVVRVGNDAWDFFLPLLTFGAGTGLMLSQIGNLTLSAVPAEQSPEASGVQNTFKETGTSLGTAVIGSVLLAATFSGIVGGVVRAGDLEVSDDERDQLVIDFEDADKTFSAEQKRAFAHELDELTGGRFAEIQSEAQVDALRTSLLIMAGAILLALLVSSFLPGGRLETRPGAREPDRLPDRSGPVPERST